MSTLNDGFLEDEIEYIIYCRRSSDESSKQQVQSIPTQIEHCLNYAQKEGITIAQKPNNFPFETNIDLDTEDNDTDILARRIYQDTRNLFIIKESETGKIPYKRKKRRKLIDMVESGKVKGILSYSPDRQARNILEGGELINFVDEGRISLRYANFHFDPNAAGKMMLGIRFVFSKQYSDKTSEDILKGKAHSVGQGKSQGRYKYGYIRDEQTGYYVAHPKYFDLMKEAFKLKIYKNKSDKYIAKRLTERGFQRETKNTIKGINASTLNNIRRNPFYYGMYVEGHNTIDLRESIQGFEPLISEEEHDILVQRYYKTNPTLPPKEIKEENDLLRPFSRGFMRTEDGIALSFNMPSKGRYRKKREKELLTNKESILEDFVGPHQLHYRNQKTKTKSYGISITFDRIDQAVKNILSKITIDNKTYVKYVEYYKDEITKKDKEDRTKLSILRLELNRTSSKRKEYITKMMGELKTDEEKEIYQQHLKGLEKQRANLQNDIDAIDNEGKDELYNFEMLVEILKNASSFYAKQSYVRKGKIIEILFSNIILNNKKELEFLPKPGFEILFPDNLALSGDDGIRTHV